MINFTDCLVLDSTTLDELLVGQKRMLEAMNMAGGSTPSPAEVAQTELRALAGTQFDTVFGGYEDEPPVLTAVQQLAVDALLNEESVVAYMTPILQPLVAPNVLVNSETVQWLVSPNGKKKKPDLYSTPVWTYTKRTQNSTNQLLDATRRFGTIEDKRLYDQVQILDCKCSVTDTATGEAIDHMRTVTFKQSGLASGSSGMVFGKRAFSLLRVQDNRLVFRQVGMWTDPGSARLIKEFLASPSAWCTTDDLLRSSEWRVADPHRLPSLSTAFIGQGGYGRVIKVVPSTVSDQVAVDADYGALKMVPKEKMVDLVNEYDALSKHSQACNCSLICRPVSDVLTSSLLCGFVQSPVGLCSLTRGSISKTNNMLTVIGVALFNLHNHNPPMFHGDARIQNLVVSDKSSLFWVDLRTSKLLEGQNMSVLRRFDVKILIDSIVDGATEQANVVIAIDTYCTVPTEANMMALMALVHNVLWT